MRRTIILRSNKKSYQNNSFLMSERGIWAHIFNANGYTNEDIIKMDTSTFQQLVNYFFDSGFNPDKEAPEDFLRALNKSNTKQVSQRNPRKNEELSDSQLSSLMYSFNFSSQGSSQELYEPTDSQLIQQDQNEQYVVTLSKMQQLERESQLRKEEEEMKVMGEIALKRSKLDAAKKKITDNARQIPKEPESTNSDVISISVILPGGRRVVRRFASSELASNVYSWVSCFEELFDQIDESISLFNEDSDATNNKDSNKNSNDESTKTEDFLNELEKKIENLGMPMSFHLVQPPQTIIDETKTLFEQKVGKRALFNVVLDD